MQRGLVAVGYAVGVALVAAHRRGVVPKPFFWTHRTSFGKGFGVDWLVEISVWRRTRAKKGA